MSVVIFPAYEEGYIVDVAEPRYYDNGEEICNRSLWISLKKLKRPEIIVKECNRTLCSIVVYSTDTVNDSDLFYGSIPILTKRTARLEGRRFHVPTNGAVEVDGTLHTYFGYETEDRSFLSKPYDKGIHSKVVNALKVEELVILPEETEIQGLQELANALFKLFLVDLEKIKH